MRFQLIEKEKHSMLGLWRGIWMAALMGTLLSLLNSMEYWWAVIPGVIFVIAVGFLPRKQQNLVALALFALLVAWMHLRYKPVLNGWGFLVNRLLALSEESQGYYYEFFTVVGEAPAESLVVLSCLIGVLCIWLGGAVNLVLTLALAVAIAYFGVVPSIVWLCILLVVAFANALPKQGRWLPAVLIAILVFATAISIKLMAPEPNLQIETLIENFWEFFVPPDDPEIPPTAPTEMEEPTQTETLPEEPSETQAPTEPEEDFTLPDYTEVTGQTEFVEVPTQEQQAPAGGPTIKVPDGKKHIGAWKMVRRLRALAVLLVIAVLVVLYRLNTRKRKQNRMPIHTRNNAKAIRGMYLYAKRWRKFNPSPAEIPQEVQAIWLEAAYSEHKMTAKQKKIMRSYMRRSAMAAWKSLKWWERLLVYWYYAL